MSTVAEAITAAHCGLEVLAFSVIANMAAGISESPIDIKNVNCNVAGVEKEFRRLICEIIRCINLKEFN